MINRLNFEGYIEKIIFRNSQVVKFTVVNQVKGKTKKITATLFNRDDLVMSKTIRIRRPMNGLILIVCK